MQKNKRLILAAVAVAAAAAVMAVIYFATRPETDAGSKTFTVEVVHGDGTSKTFTCHTDAEYLGEALLAEGLIKGHSDTFGLYVDTVDGEDAVWDEDNSYWALYVEGEYAAQGIGLTPVTDGGAFSLVYTVG